MQTVTFALTYGLALNNKMTTSQYVVGTAISGLALGLMALRYFYPAYPVDATTLGLLCLAVLPWLSHFFKKFKVPGIIEGESHDRVQSSTSSPTPPKILIANEKSDSAPASARFRDLAPESRKILRTLWRYQKDLFKNDYSRRWTFAVRPSAPAYHEYLDGISPLLKLGLISVSPETLQCMLTNEGIILMESLPPEDISGDFYVF